MNKVRVYEFIPPYPLKVAVLFLVFNRLDTTRQVFEQIRKAKPQKFYIAGDGPRKNVSGEAARVREVREYILDNIDWDCEIKTLFRDNNLGCKYAVSRAITWFFKHEEMGIILEDDTVPSLSFFWFCENLLERYKDDLRIWHIGGYKYPGLSSDEYSYNFSRFTHIWGWATWKSRWTHYQVELNDYLVLKSQLEQYDFFSSKKEIVVRKKILDAILTGRINTWDYQWNFCVRINNGLAIRPSLNLVRNIGWGDEATHTNGNLSYLVENDFCEIEFPLKHPPFFMVNKYIDEQYLKKYLLKNKIGLILNQWRKLLTF